MIGDDDGDDGDDDEEGEGEGEWQRNYANNKSPIIPVSSRVGRRFLMESIYYTNRSH